MKDETPPDQAAPQQASAAADPAERVRELEARCAELETRWLRAQADYQNARRRAPLTTPESQALAAGVQLTRSKLAQALERVDVRPVATSGTFDPAQHEAVETRPSTSPPGTILATLRPGYTWQGRILRPARVAVAAAEVPGTSE